MNKEIEQWPILPSLNPDHIISIDYFANNRWAIVVTGSFTKKVVCYVVIQIEYINQLASVKYQLPKLVFVEYQLDILGTVTLVSNWVYCPVYLLNCMTH